MSTCSKPVHLSLRKPAAPKPAASGPVYRVTKEIHFCYATGC